MITPRLSFIPVLVIWVSALSGQPDDSINFDKLTSARLIALLEDNHLYSSEDLKDIGVSCYSPGPDSLSFSSHTKSFIIEAPIEKVWQAYKTVSPTAPADRRDMVSFGLLYDKMRNKIYYQEDAYEGLQEGQLVFWNLRILGGLVKLSVGQTITEVNDEEKYFEICYLTQGTSHGSQYIRLFETAEGHTEVVHYTRFRSASRFRDRRLYPGLHEKAITEFHENIKTAVKEDLL